MRLFVGLPIAPVLVDELAAISMRWRSSEDGLRWSESASWHITLQFLGNTAEEKYECILARLREVRSAAVPIALEGLGFFDRAGIFYAGVALTPELITIQQKVTSATSPCGFIPETRPYHPHITLARTKSKPKALDNLKAMIQRQPKFTGYVAEEFLLYESRLTPKGSFYEVRERFILG